MAGQCQKAHRHEWRIKVELFLDIPARLGHRLAKRRLRSKDVQVDGANWPKARSYCVTCGASEDFAVPPEWKNES